MANYYWVGGTDTWDNTANSKWATASGGTTYWSVPPSSSDSVFFDANSGSNIVTLGINPVIFKLTMTGFTGRLAFGTQNISLTGNATTIYTGATTFSVTGTPVINCTYSGSTGTRTLDTKSVTETNAISFNISAGTDIFVLYSAVFKNLDFTGFSGALLSLQSVCYGNLTMSTGMTVTNPGYLNFSATSGIQLITSNGVTLKCTLNINCIGAIVQLVDDVNAQDIYLSYGTFDANNKNVILSGAVNSQNANTRSLIMGSGTWTFTGTSPGWYMSNSNNLTFSGALASIVLSSTGTRTMSFQGSGQTIGSLNIGGATGTSTTTISSTTFITIASTKTVAHTITFNTNGINYVTNWLVTGSPGNLVTINSSVSGTQSNVTYIGIGKLCMDYVSIKDTNFYYGYLSASNPYKVYAGSNSINGGNNYGVAFVPLTQKAYLITTSETWVVPADWNNSSNTIHLIGAGGGGATSVASGNNRAAGGGGGGGGYTVLTNQTLSGSISCVIGSSTANADGGNTIFNSTYTAGGGKKGTATTTPTSAGGAGGTGTYAGGVGGAGGFGTTASTGYGSGGGGGAGGPNGVGGAGGDGTSSTTNASGGGGGGNGGGSAGASGNASTGGIGGNNFNGVGGGIAYSGPGGAGLLGGGGAGAIGLGAAPGSGGGGVDVANTIGGAGGQGGLAGNSPGLNQGLYGGGGCGGGVTQGGGVGIGGAGSQGAIFITYTPHNGFLSIF